MSKPKANSLDRTLAIIQYLEANGEGGVRETSRVLRFSSSSTHRHLQGLLMRGVCKQNPQNYKYSLCAMNTQLAHLLAGPKRINRSLARRLIDALRALR